MRRKEESEAASEALQLQEDAEDSGPRAVRMRMGKPADGYMLMEEKEFLVVLDRYINEPKGNVGKIYRRILGKYYCR